MGGHLFGEHVEEPRNDVMLDRDVRPIFPPFLDVDEAPLVVEEPDGFLPGRDARGLLADQLEDLRDRVGLRLPVLCVRAAAVTGSRRRCPARRPSAVRPGLSCSRQSCPTAPTRR